LRNKQSYGFSTYRSTTSLPSTLKAENTMPMLFHDNHAKRSVPTVTFKAQADIKQVQAIAAVAAAGWDPVALRTGQNRITRT
jgi:hypothetical protein